MNENIDLFPIEGYCILRKVIDPQLIGSIGSFLNDRVEKILLKYRHIERLTDFISANFNQLSPAEQHLLSGHFDLETRLSETLVSILDADLLISKVKTILKDENPKLHIPPAARWVLPYSKLSGVPPHQDIAYNASLESFVVAWTPFTKISQECGGVKVYPKNGENTIHYPNKEDFWLAPIPTSGQGIHCTIDIGDILLLDPYIVHKSMPNLSKDVRISIDYRFYQSKVDSGKHFMYINDRKIIAP